MDKKVVVYVAATAITLATGLTAANAAPSSFSNLPNPTVETISPAASGDYIVSQFTFARSPNVFINYDAGATGTVAGDSAMATGTNASKGNRSFGGAVGAINSTARACQNTGTTVIATPPAADKANVTTCTF